MFCKNCGNQMDNLAVVCVKCGVPAGQGNNFCPNCGAQTVPDATACMQCGVALSQPVPQGTQKSKIVAGLLGIFVGSLGIHNFYLGYKSKAIAQLLITVCTCGAGAAVTEIWGLIEGILILVGNINTDADGIPLKD